MTIETTDLAVFRGSKTSPQMKAWNALPEVERKAREQEGMAGSKAWAEQHGSRIVEIGGPLGRTKTVSQAGIANVSNEMGAFVMVRAASHEKAAARFANHPHFTDIPGESIEVTSILPVLGA